MSPWRRSYDYTYYHAHEGLTGRTRGPRACPGPTMVGPEKHGSHDRANVRAQR